MNRAAQGVVLLLVGGAVLRASLTDLYLRYVREGMRPFLIAAGIVLVVVAVATLIPEFVRRDDDAEPAPGRADGPGDEPDDHSEHGGHREPRVSWLMILPVLALLLIAPPALGSDAANNNGTALASAEDSDFPPLPKGDPAKIGVMDYAARAVFEDGASLGNRRVELTGFILVGKDGERYLARMILSCCAADARPIKVALAGDVTDLAQETWVRVVGRYADQERRDSVNGMTIPYLDVESVKRIPAPKKQYE